MRINNGLIVIMTLIILTISFIGVGMYIRSCYNNVGIMAAQSSG